MCRRDSSPSPQPRCPHPPHADSPISVLLEASADARRWRQSRESRCFSLPRALFPGCLLSAVCVSNCRSWVPSLTLGGCFLGLWVSVCLSVGASVCLAVSPAESVLDPVYLSMCVWGGGGAPSRRLSSHRPPLQALTQPRQLLPWLRPKRSDLACPCSGDRLTLLSAGGGGHGQALNLWPLPAQPGARRRPGGGCVLPSRLGPLAPHLPLCNSTTVCALQVTLDPALGSAQSPTHMGAGADPWSGPLLSAAPPPPFSLGRSFP